MMTSMFGVVRVSSILRVGAMPSALTSVLRNNPRSTMLSNSAQYSRTSPSKPTREK